MIAVRSLILSFEPAFYDIFVCTTSSVSYVLTCKSRNRKSYLVRLHFHTVTLLVRFGFSTFAPLLVLKTSQSAATVCDVDYLTIP